MKIGIGNTGGTFPRKLSAAGHRATVTNSKRAESVRSFADEIDATALDVRGGVAVAYLVIMSMPLPAIAKLPKNLFDSVPRDVPVVDTSNYYPGTRDPQIAELDVGEVESIWVSKQLGRPATKTFNNILASSLAEPGQPENSPGRLTIAVAGDEALRKKVVHGIINEVGFDPVDAGSLDESWRQQPSTPAYCCDYDVDTMRKDLALTLPGEASESQTIL